MDLIWFREENKPKEYRRLNPIGGACFRIYIWLVCWLVQTVKLYYTVLYYKLRLQK